jgi:hypothetical protein
MLGAFDRCSSGDQPTGLAIAAGTLCPLADRRASAFKRVPMATAARGATTKAAGTQKAARRTAAVGIESDRPLAFATRPETAAPNAIPTCCTVGTAEAAMFPSPCLAPLMTCCAMNAQQPPMPMPIAAIGSGSTDTGPGAKDLEVGLQSEG